jgi:DNA sulfur modification protein DndD
VSLFSREKRKLEREEDKLKGKQELAKEIAEGIIPLSPNLSTIQTKLTLIKE